MTKLDVEENEILVTCPSWRQSDSAGQMAVLIWLFCK